MRSFPILTEFPIFVGNMISQICLNPYGVAFSFENGAHINAEFGLEQLEPDGTLYSYDCAGWSGPPLVLHRLPNQPIVSFDRKDFRLTFRFNQGSSLAILSEDSPYESGQINVSGKFIVF